MSKSLGFTEGIHTHNLNIPKTNRSFNCAAHGNLQCDISMTSEKSQNSSITRKDVLWQYLSLISYVLSSSCLFVYAIFIYEAKYDAILPSLIGVALLIAFITWFRNMLSMNMFQENNITKTRVYALVLYILSGSCFVASSIAVMQQLPSIQFICSFLASVIGWQAFVIIFEGSYKLPTKQQLAALLQILILSGLWEFRTFLVNAHFIS